MSDHACTLCGGSHPPGSCSSGTPSLVGQVLSEKYQLVRKLGEGGMGAVYEARHVFVGRRFAIKFLHPEISRHPEMMGRFQREAQAAGSLESEHIVAVTDFGLAPGGAPYMVMELLDGEDLRGLLARIGVLPVGRAVQIVIQACRGLELAHAQGLVHRDLKPENLFVSRRSDGVDLVKVLDFGIAKLRGATQSHSTREGTMMGTLHYMPPEQVRGDKNIDHRADIYALGCILYEALSGRVPHDGEEPHVVIYRILSEPVAPLDSLRPGLPAGLGAVVHRALTPDANGRFASAAELARALSAFAERQVTPFEPSVLEPAGEVPLRLVSRASSLGAATRSVAEAAPPGSQTSVSSQPKRKRLVLAAVGLALSGALALGLVIGRPRVAEVLAAASPAARSSETTEAPRSELEPARDAPREAPPAPAAPTPDPDLGASAPTPSTVALPTASAPVVASATTPVTTATPPTSAAQAQPPVASPRAPAPAMRPPARKRVAAAPASPREEAPRTAPPAKAPDMFDYR